MNVTESIDERLFYRIIINLHRHRREYRMHSAWAEWHHRRRRRRHRHHLLVNFLHYLIPHL